MEPKENRKQTQRNICRAFSIYYALMMATTLMTMVTNLLIKMTAGELDVSVKCKASTVWMFVALGIIAYLTAEGIEQIEKRKKDKAASFHFTCTMGCAVIYGILTAVADIILGKQMFLLISSGAALFFAILAVITTTAKGDADRQDPTAIKVFMSALIIDTPCILYLTKQIIPDNSSSPEFVFAVMVWVVYIALITAVSSQFVKKDVINDNIRTLEKSVLLTLTNMVTAIPDAILCVVFKKKKHAK